MNIRLHFYYLLILIYTLGLVGAYEKAARKRIQPPDLIPGPPGHKPGDERPPHYDHRPHSYKKHINNIPAYNLTDLIDDKILNKYGNSCRASVLTSGFISLASNSWHLRTYNYTLNYPSFLIRCDNGSDFSHILQDFVYDISNKFNIQDDSSKYIGKDPFPLGMIMITFASGCICVATWMLFLVVLLLPSDNHNRRNKVVHIYVLFSAIIKTVFLNETIAVIFDSQYHDDYQDASQFESSIVETAPYKICELVTNILSDINWIYIVHYLQSNYGKPTWNWIPFKMKKGSHFIIIVGCLLSLVDNILFGNLLWRRNIVVLKVFFKVIDLLIYTIFISIICYFTWHNFAYILLPRTAETNTDGKCKTQLRILWENYHETIPLLAYNMIIFILFYFTTIFFTAFTKHVRGWTFNFVHFLRVLITVNVWGLIGVLEKRELHISKKTVLGRKINNRDKFFANPTVNYYGDDLGKHVSTITLNRELNPTQSKATSHGSSSLVASPLPIWKSPIERIRERRRRHKIMKNENKLEQSLGFGSKSNFKPNTKTAFSKYRQLLRKPKRKANSHGPKPEIGPNKKSSVVRPGAANHTGDSNYLATDFSDNESMETELRTNHIYNYESSE
ncbi:Dfg16p [Saccharomyces paradoxus]|uniref:Dfg16p n=1 Tax=Saccharomyces paradoxus TaxID=27291 RepID=A0A8B8UZM8_SACPA|nr:Dfg16 [Saccharomyces paradoxus]QHS76146.1 Dfg16 [Saccharomyces paradoxus]